MTFDHCPSYMNHILVYPGDLVNLTPGMETHLDYSMLGPKLRHALKYVCCSRSVRFTALSLYSKFQVNTNFSVIFIFKNQVLKKTIFEFPIFVHFSTHVVTDFFTHSYSCLYDTSMSNKTIKEQ